MTINTTIDVWSAVGWSLTAAGLSFAALQLRREYAWRRREYAVRMCGEWNRHTAEHREAIEQAFPGLLDVAGKRAEVDIPADRAESLYHAGKQCLEDAKLNRHVIELLNYCEYAALSYSFHIAHSELIECSFRNALLHWHRGLRPYIEVTKRYRGYNPWQPFCTVVEVWENEARDVRRGTAPFSARRGTGRS